jgi:hypothetical protein
MLNIKIITIHAMQNPGSALQAYALQNYLSRHNNVKIIDYRPNYLYTEGKGVLLFLKKLLFKKSYFSRKKKFDKFVSENMRLTKLYYSLEALINDKLDADIFIAGSDQLWNSDFPCGNDRAYYLDFVQSGKKVSYATSVGKQKIGEENLEILKKYLPSFSMISTREKSTAIFLSGVLNRKVEWVCDPVFLLAKADYMQFVNSEISCNSKYAMVYLSPKSELLDKIVAYYKELGYKIILVGGMTKRCQCDQHIKDAGPKEFLSYIYHAEVVISTSFHATAFCHIFHIPFVTILPKANGERIMDLLSTTGLQNRAVIDNVDMGLIDTAIDWKQVDIKLNKHIEQSKSYLERAVSED